MADGEESDREEVGKEGGRAGPALRMDFFLCLFFVFSFVYLFWWPLEKGKGGLTMTGSVGLGQGKWPC